MVTYLPENELILINLIADTAQLSSDRLAIPLTCHIKVFP
jgi:hypothetical protein